MDTGFLIGLIVLLGGGYLLITKKRNNFFLTSQIKQVCSKIQTYTNRFSERMHWISILFYRIPLFILSPLLRNSNKQKRIESITNYKLLT